MKYEPHLLDEANDLKLVFDELDKRIRQFPQLLVNTALRPDLVIFSDTLRNVILMELTCGNEENFENQKSRKEKRYEQLEIRSSAQGIRESNRWEAQRGEQQYPQNYSEEAVEEI